jgi:hypothetical protein
MAFDEWARDRLGELLRFATALCCDPGLALQIRPANWSPPTPSPWNSRPGRTSASRSGGATI